MQDIAEQKNAFLRAYKSGYPDRLTEEYELLECLSRSELCETILAKHRATGKRVVVKCYCKGHSYFEGTEPEQIRGFSFEGIPSCEGEYRNESMRCILREYVEGESLWECSRVYFSTEFICRTGIELCRILEYLHSQKIPVIHRDIKPQNVILKKNGRVALIDFGISRLYQGDKTGDTRISGTRNFSPPEQYGFGQTDERSDIYSLGMLLTWMLTGEEKRIGKPASPLERVLYKCTAFTPRRRYASAKSLRLQLERFVPAYGRGYRQAAVCTAGGVFLGIGVCLAVWGAGRASEAAFGESPAADTQPGFAADGVFPTGQASYAAGTKRPGAGSPAAGTAAEGNPEGAVTFSEPLIEQAVRLELNRPEGTITKEDLSDVTEILIYGEEIFSSRDSYFWYCNGINPDEIPYGSIASLEDIRNMPNLKHLFLSRQKIRDISPVEGLVKLKELNLEYNEIADLSPVCGLRQLEMVEVFQNQIRDISPLAELDYLRNVGLGGNPVRDISPLEECRYISTLNLASMDEFDGKPIEGMDGLDFLDINGADTDAWKYLSGKTITTLKMGAPGQTDLSCIRDIAHVEELYIYWSHITDISAIQGREDITYLNMAACLIEDLSPVFTLPNLKTVVISVKVKGEMEALLASHGGKSSFAVEYMD